MKRIKQRVFFKAKPHEIYEMLMDEKKHSEFTGDKAKISKKVGGKFSAYGKYIEGENLELKKDKIIVQKWRSTDFPKGHYSTVTFEINKNKEGTELIFTQEEVTDEEYEGLKDGWKKFYWEPMKELLEEDKNER